MAWWEGGEKGGGDGVKSRLREFLERKEVAGIGHGEKKRGEGDGLEFSRKRGQSSPEGRESSIKKKKEEKEEVVKPSTDIIEYQENCGRP